MNKKVLIACTAAFLLLIIGVVIGLLVHKKKQNQVFIDSDYPISYEIKKDHSLIIKLDGSKTKKLTWAAEVEDADYIEVTQKGKESGGKATYIVKPKQAGLTRIDFRRSADLSGYSYDAALISIPIYVSESGGALVVNFLENPRLEVGPTPIAEDTAFPFLINYVKGEEADATELLFVNGNSDWVLSDPNNILSADVIYGEGNTVHVYLSKYIEGLNQSIQSTNEVVTTEENSKAEINEDDSSDEYVVPSEDSINEFINSGSDNFIINENASPGDPDYITVYDPTAGTILETTLTVSSQSMGVTKYLDVTINTNNSITITEGKAPK